MKTWKKLKQFAKACERFAFDPKVVKHRIKDIEAFAEEIWERKPAEMYYLTLDRRSGECWLGDCPMEGMELLLSHPDPVIAAAATLYVTEPGAKIPERLH